MISPLTLARDISGTDLYLDAHLHNAVCYLYKECHNTFRKKVDFVGLVL